MKLTSLLITLSFTLIASYSSANQIDERNSIRTNSPHLEEVLTYLNQKLEYECDNCAYGVAKKRDGYYLTMYEYGSKKVNEVPVWKAESANFVELNISEYIDRLKPRGESSSDLNELYNFREKYDFMLFFGYDDWAKDAISFLEDYKNSLSSQDLEILARSHGEVASQIINNNGHKREYARIDQDKFKAFVNEAESAMAYWAKIKKTDEAYTPLIIEDLDLKIGNEYMHFYNILISLKEDKVAARFLKKAWFTPGQVQSAKNLLQGCAENGFLLTQGDSDTFPLWYVQKKFNYRADVVVLNTSLMYTPWYLQMNKERYKYKSAIDQKKYATLLEKGQYLGKETAVTPFNAWLTKRLSETTDNGKSFDLIPQAFIVPFQGANMELKLKGPAIGHNVLALLDIISSNSDREFSFVSPYQLYSLGLVDNYLMRGKSFKLTNAPSETKTDKESVIQLDNLLYHMDGGYLKGLTHTAEHELNILCYGISSLSNDFDTDKQRMLEKFIKQLPYQSAIELEDYNILEILNSFFEDEISWKSVALKRELEPTALERIKKISVLNKNLDQDLDDLEEVFSIYAGIRVQWVQYEDVIVDKADRVVLRAMKTKIDSLVESPVVLRREWTRLKIAAMKEAIDGLDLSE